MTEFTKIGKYEVVEEVGKGSFGTVYRGRDPFLKRDVAIKVCTVEDEEFRKRFFREAEIAGKLQHRNIVTVFAFGFEGEAPYLVQEFLTGRDLRQVVKDREKLSIEDKVDVLKQIAAGLGQAHAEGVFHRDIKPANVRWLEDGTVKIMDFGIAKLVGAETQLTQAGVTMGTATYLSPEQVRGGTVGPQTDIFSLGVLAYELLTYRQPFYGNTLSALIYQILYKQPADIRRLVDDCPEEVARIVERCLEKDPEQRYGDTGELAADLDRVTPTSATPTTTRAVSSSPSVKDTQPIAAIAATTETEASVVEEVPPTQALGEMPSVEPPPDPPSRSTQTDPDESQLTDRGREIGELVARGDLETAKKQLEEAIKSQSHQEKTEVAPLPRTRPPQTAVPPTAVSGAEAKHAPPPAAPPPAAPPPLPEASEPAAQPETPGGGAAALLKSLAAWWRNLPPAVQRWAPPAVAAALVLLIAVLWWMSAPAPEEPVAVVPPPPSPPPPTRPEPAALPTTGAVAVHALPWARITEISDAEGFVRDLPELFHTPVLLNLEPGSYLISLENPEYPDLLTCEVEVILEELATCQQSFGDAQALDYFKETGWWR